MDSGTSGMAKDRHPAVGPVTLSRWLALAALAVALAAVLAACSRGPGSGGDAGAGAACSTDTAAVGRAQTFTLNDPSCHPHTVQPGDGKPYLLVFYMG